MITFNAPLVPPVLNLNGSTGELLMSQQQDVILALDKAIKVMGNAAPHGRDYQTVPGKYAEARKAFEERMLALCLVRQEYRNLLDATLDANTKWRKK